MADKKAKDDEVEETAESETPIPNVQSETQHASQAAEDVRDAQVVEPNA